MAPAVARVGLVVSSKVGGAVLRNRVKRRLREALRHELHRLPPVDVVLVARPAAAAATVDELRAWVQRVVPRIPAGTRGAP
jgi:ribonuclease P protein component